MIKKILFVLGLIALNPLQGGIIDEAKATLKKVADGLKKEGATVLQDLMNQGIAKVTAAATGAAGGSGDGSEDDAGDGSGDDSDGASDSSDDGSDDAS